MHSCLGHVQANLTVLFKHNVRMSAVRVLYIILDLDGARIVYLAVASFAWRGRCKTKQGKHLIWTCPRADVYGHLHSHRRQLYGDPICTLY